MKRIICFVLAMVLLFSTAVFAHSFKDSAGHWADTEIETAYKNGVINGDPDGRFRPDDNITRGEFLKMLVAEICAKAEVVIAEEYADDSHWASKYYNFATEQLYTPLEETVDEIKPGLMSAENYDVPISRWEMAFLLSNCITNATGVVGNRVETSYGDLAEIEEKYPKKVQAAISNCFGLGIMVGDEKNNFNAAQSGTRAEAVTVINRVDTMIRKVVDQQQQYIDEYNKQIENSLVTYEDIPTKHPVVTILMDNNKKILVELYPEYAPQTVANFVKLVKDGFYDGLTFHRIVPGFVAQGGDPKGDGTGGSEGCIKGEFAANGFETNTLKHTRGVISMARSQHFDSASSQFFICLSDDCNLLDGSYAAFGKVISGMDVLDEYAKGELLMNSSYEVSSPAEPVVIKKMTVTMK